MNSVYFLQKNNCLPDGIVVFRDGVGDGAMQYVAGHEVKQMTEAMSQYREGYKPKFAHVIVQKRINMRLFAHCVS